MARTTTRSRADELNTAEPLVPDDHALSSLERAAADCTACDLHLTGTQTVFGAGAAEAKVMFVGEQPGNEEDLQGEPFVGPAGRVLDRALAEAGVDRRDVYVTNAVKHFKWVGRGKKRIHQKPNAREIRACRPWLTAEIESLQPDLIVCLGATAAQSMLGPAFKVTEERGHIIEREGQTYMATVHPSSILRTTDDDTRRLERARFTDDLRIAARFLHER